MQVLSVAAVGLEISRAVVFESRLVRRSQICRAAEKPGDVLRYDVEHRTGCVPSGDALGVGWKDWEILSPAGRQLPPLHLIDLGREIRMLGAVGLEQVHTLPPR